MNDTQITRLAQLLALKTAADSVNTMVEGMKAGNESRAAQGYSQAYSNEAFLEAAEELLNLAEQMKQI